MHTRALAGGFSAAAVLAAIVAASTSVAGPPAAAGAQGMAVINCKVDGDRSLSDCKVLRESPPGRGFGALALQMSRVVHVPPGKGLDASGRVTLPMLFQPNAGSPDADDGGDQVVGPPPALDVPGAAQL